MGIADNLRRVRRYKLYAPYFFYTPILILICTAAGLRGKHTVFYVAALLASGFLSRGLIEYTVHRFVLHSRRSFLGARLPGNLTHLRHHHQDARARYGVTTPLFDYLFGTFHLEKKAPWRRTAEGAGLDTLGREFRASCAS